MFRHISLHHNCIFFSFFSFFYSQKHGIKLIKKNSTYPAYFKICNPTQKKKKKKKKKKKMPKHIKCAKTLEPLI
jgi:hypothetical protein